MAFSRLLRAVLAACVLALALLSAADVAEAKKSHHLVREVRSYREFQALIDHHKTKTGLGVIVDFYSDSCGPCRQIAPLYKQLAKQYKGKVVFAKVNVQTAHEVSSRMGIRSMPTFHFYHLGKKKQEFSGGDSGRLQQFARSLASAGSAFQVMITDGDLADFYAEHDPTKTSEDVHTILSKYEPRIGHYKLAKKLAKKYGTAPKTVPYKKSAAGKKSREAPTPGPTARPQAAKAKPPQANLELATVEELQAELDKRQADDDDGDDDDDDDDDDELDLTQYQKEDDFPERVVIVGAGPAGLAAAIYTARAGLGPVIVAPPLGGQLQGKGVTVENYPGVSGNTGPGIVNLMLKQAHEVGCTFLQDEVVSMDLTSRPFRVTTKNNVTVPTHSVIMATGANSRWLGVEGEDRFRGGGVSTCATCDGFLFRDEPVLVVGGGDTAMEDALVLARTSSHVTLVHRRGEFRASKILAERVHFHDRITVMWNTTVQSFEGETQADPDTGEEIHRLTHVVLRRNCCGEQTNEIDTLYVKGAFVAIGHDPATGLLRGQGVELDANNYVVTQGRSTHTSVEGVFAAGDVMDHVYRQAVTSAGSGTAAALDAERWLSTQGIKDEREECLDDILSEVVNEFTGKY